MEGGRANDAELVERLRAGDEEAFVGLVDELSPALLRMALMHVPSRAVAEDVVADTWLGVIKGIDRFEGRSALAHMDLPDPAQHRAHARTAREAGAAVLLDPAQRRRTVTSRPSTRTASRGATA